jgi:hypothetical protein
MNELIFTSISISDERLDLFNRCMEEHTLDAVTLLSVLCYKAGMYFSENEKGRQSIDYQDRGCSYSTVPVFFYAADHEYIHACRLSSKISVSKLLALANDLFINELIEKGINPLEIARLRVVQNSYKKKSFIIRNFTCHIEKNDQYYEYGIKIRKKKT